MIRYIMWKSIWSPLLPASFQHSSDSPSCCQAQTEPTTMGRNRLRNTASHQPVFWYFKEKEPFPHSVPPSIIMNRWKRLQPATYIVSGYAGGFQNITSPAFSLWRPVHSIPPRNQYHPYILAFRLSAQCTWDDPVRWFETFWWWRWWWPSSSVVHRHWSSLSWCHFYTFRLSWTTFGMAPSLTQRE